MIGQWKILGLWCVVALFAAPVHAQDSLLPTLQALRSDYPTPMLPVQVGELLTRTAQAGGPQWALLKKPAGNRCPTPWADVSCDYLVFAPTGQGFDVLRDVEGAAEPTWGAGDSFTPDRLLFLPATPSPTPTPQPVPPSIADDLTALVDLTARLETGQGTIRDQIAASTARILAALPAASEPVPPVVTPPTSDRPWWADVFLSADTLKVVGGAVGAAIATYYATRQKAAEPALAAP